MKKILSLIILISMLGTTAYADWRSEMAWAVEGVDFCMGRGILQGDNNGDLLLNENLTRSQAAKMLCQAFGLTDDGNNSYNDTDPNCWDYTYINAIEKYIPKKPASFRGSDAITREEFAAFTASVIGYTSDYDNSLNGVFADTWNIDYDYRGYILKTTKSGIIQGSDGNFRPKANITRAEACTVILRAVQANSSIGFGAYSPVQQFTTSTAILGAPQISVEQAQAWARSKGATEKFINIAPTYWYYGELMGIRPEVLYAQSALETGYGRYTGVVSEDMNNWAGIKVKGRNDDAKEAHETFATPEDGARAHFNHMAAYVGVAPVGEPHGRYYSVKSINWAGTVRTLEELSGKWCPDPNYANKILEGCLIPMSKF